AADYAEPDAVPYENGGEEPSFPHRLPTEPLAAARNLIYFPWMDSLIGAFALEGARQLGLGRRTGPDLLAVSFSTTDEVGHRYGPDSRELHDHLIRLDRWLGWFLDSLATLVPAERTVVVLTADHGVQSFPEIARQAGVRGAGRVWLGDVAARMGSDLAARYRLDFQLRFDRGLIAADTVAMHARGIPVDSLAATLARAARSRPGVARVFTPATLPAAPPGDREATLWKNQIPAGFGWLLCAANEPGYLWSSPGRTQADHGSTAPADVTVPIAFLGAGIRPARLDRPVRTVDIPPTLAALIGVRPTEALDGVVLPEIVGPRPH
ncbi:MAG: alkaline phosphatase family protein, partial [Gemmatimonadales bacterium]